MRWKWITGIGVVLIVAFMVAVYVFLDHYDYNKLKPRISQVVKDATGRKLNLAGDINLVIGFSPTLAVTDVSLANASWGSQPQMIKVGELQARVRLLPLLFRDVELRHIGLVDVEVLLETDSNGNGNWNFSADPSPGNSAGAFKAARIDIDSIRIKNLQLAFRRGKTESTRRYSLASLDVAKSEAGDELTIDLKAEYDRQPIALSGKTGLIRYLFAHQRFPLELAGKFSKAKFEISGAIDDALNLEGIDLKLNGSGRDLSAVGSIIGEKLPATDKFAVKGQLAGSAKALSLKAAQGNAQRGSMRLTLEGGIKDLLNFNGVDLEAKGSGKSLSEVGAIIEKKLPATDEFAVEGRLTGSAKALSLKEAQGSAKQGSLSLALSGGIKDLIAFSGMDLKLKSSGKDLAEVGAIIGQKLPATDEFAIEARLTGSAKSLSLQQAQGSANRGSLNLTLNGGIEELPALNGINFNVKASGKELAEIGPMVGADLPELGPFNVSAALSGSAKAISLNEFEAILDKSDFKGLAKVEFRKRPKITMQLESSVLDFTGLMKSLEKDQQALETEEKREHHLFPDDPLPFDTLKRVDADIVLKARNMHVKDARLEFGHLSLKLEDSDFSIDKLEATYKQTKISGNLNLKAGSPTHAATRFLVQNLDLGGLLKEAGVNDQVRAHVDIGAHLKSRGDSVRALMANLDGSIGATMGQGYLTHYLDLLSINLTQKVTHFWKLNQSAHQIKCAVIQFDIKDGIATSQAFVFDTQLGTVIGEGQINLGTEQVNFLLVPKSKDLITVGISPKLRVTGMLLDAKVSPDKLAMLTSGAKALSSLAIGPLGLLAPFVHLGAVKAHPCDIKSIGQIGLSTTSNE